MQMLSAFRYCARREWLLFSLPILFFIIMVALRRAAGPFWLWSNLDPDYFYLFDALNLVGLRAPGHVYHPGTPLQVLGAVVLKTLHPLSDADAIARAVLADPESHLAAISNVLIALNALAVLAVGTAGLFATGRLAVAIFLQLAPFLSSLTLKHEFHVRPEALLVFSVLALMTVAVLALKPGLLERHRWRFALAFGAVAGFGVATKITAAPIFLMPLFLLATPTALALYAIFAFAAFILFTLPMAGHYPVFVEWVAKVILGAGVHGRGPAIVVDLVAYPGEVLRMLKRPPIPGALVVGSIALAFAAWRGRSGRPLPGPEARVLAGVVVAQVAQAIIVGKQPGGQYMIPAYVLSGLMFATVANIIATARPAEGKAHAWAGRAVVMAGAVLLFAQGFTAMKLGRELVDIRRTALALDDRRFERCARFYFYAASSPSFALYLGDFVTAVAFDGRVLTRGQAGYLKERTPPNDYWLEDWWRPGIFTPRGTQGIQDAAAIAARYPCLIVRGGKGRRSFVESYLAKALPNAHFMKNCSTQDEPVFTTGISCSASDATKP